MTVSYDREECKVNYIGESKKHYLYDRYLKYYDIINSPDGYQHPPGPLVIVNAKFDSDRALEPEFRYKTKINRHNYNSFKSGLSQHYYFNKFSPYKRIE